MTSKGQVSVLRLVHFIFAFLFCYCGCDDWVLNSRIKTNNAIFTKFFRNNKEKTFACVKVAFRQ